MTKINKQALKAYFQTGKIPTQADFENLISKIPNTDLTGRGIIQYHL
jgi:hypothetical protein